jgi:hypothetical protein
MFASLYVKQAFSKLAINTLDFSVFYANVVRKHQNAVKVAVCQGSGVTTPFEHGYIHVLALCSKHIQEWPGLLKNFNKIFQSKGSKIFPTLARVYTRTRGDPYIHSSALHALYETNKPTMYVCITVCRKNSGLKRFERKITNFRGVRPPRGVTRIC